ncbi:MAG: AAA family ATPase, partial [Synergistaceae bacterium]|nr:AAA family ATPase [Synergistaceae bacterium]
MRMTGASCGQYAGLRDVDVTFGPGLNVIVGPNESGKSSLLSLVSNVLCRPGKVGRSKAEDKEFRHAAFPAPFRDGAPSGDAIDGRVAFDAGDGEASIVRRWGPKGGSELRTARGDTLTDEGTIRAELEGALTWGAGVWQELLLAPKGGASLRALFETPSQSRSAKDLEAAAARAFAEAGAGPSISAMEQALRERLADVEGKWDAEQGRPVRKGDGKRWARGAGEVVEAWYALEDARGELAKAEELAKELEVAGTRLEGAEAALSEAEAALEAHRGSMGRLEEARRQRAELEALRKDLAEAERALEGWPAWQEAAGRIEASCEELSWAVAVERARRLEELDRAIAEAERVRAHAPSQEDVDAAREAGGSTRELEALRKEMEEADRALEGWPLWEEAVRRVEALREELSRAVAVERALRLEELEAAMGDLERVRAHAPSQEDVDAAREAERDAREIEARLGGMSVAATVRMEGGHEIVARSSLTGEEIPVVDGRIAIDGAVTLRIDGVMEMELAPAGVDVMAVRRELDDRRAALGASLARWGVGSVEELAGRAREGAEAEREMERLGAQREALLGGDEEDAVFEAGLMAGPARERDAIEAELRELCGEEGPEAYVARARAELEGAARAYGTREDLAARVEGARREQDDRRRALSDALARWGAAGLD